MTLQDYKNKAWDIVRKIYDLERETGYLNEDHATKLEINTSDPSELFDLAQANKALGMLEGCSKCIAYALSPIQHEGEIVKNQYDQYELDGVTLDCGTRFEVKLYDPEEERYQYTYTTIEHDGQSYFLTCNGQRDIEGLEARMRD